MSRKQIGMMLAASMLALPSAGNAVVPIDSMRCESLQLRHDGRLYSCVARCDQRSERDATRSARQAPPADGPSCEEACHAQHEIAVEHTNQKPPCADPSVEEQMNPNECQAQMLRAQATWMLCKSRCHSSALKHGGCDEDQCIASCDTRYGTSTDAIHAVPGCMETQPFTDAESP